MFDDKRDPATDLLDFIGDHRFAAVLADPPWRFANRTGKMAPSTGGFRARAR